MPSALQATRDFLAHQVARSRIAAQRYVGGLDQEGPPIKVTPFGPGSVTTGAALLKTATSIGAAIRSRANYRASLADAANKQELVRAEIARARAQADYYEGTGRQTGATEATTSIPITIGGKTYPTGTPRGDLAVVSGADAHAQSEADRKVAADALAGTRREAQARFALGQIDKSAAGDIQLHTDAEMRKRLAILHNSLQSSDQGVRDSALKDYGITGQQYDNTASDARARLALHKDMEAQLGQRVKSMVTKNINLYYAPKRAQYQGVIEGGAGGGPAPSEAAATPSPRPAAPPASPAGPAMDPNDPLGILPH